MPTVSFWAEDLRAVFGRDEMQATLREQGYYASEGGRTIDTRKVKLGEGLPVSMRVIGPQASAQKKVVRG